MKNNKISFPVKNDQSYREGYVNAFRGLFFKEKIIDTALAPDAMEKIKQYGFSLRGELFDPIGFFCLIYGLRKRTVLAWCNEENENYHQDFADVFEECYCADWLRYGNRLFFREKDDAFDDKLFEKRQWWVYKKDIRMPKAEENNQPAVAFPMEVIKQAFEESR